MRLAKLMLLALTLSVAACDQDDDDGLQPNGCRWRGAVVVGGLCRCPQGTERIGEECFSAEAAARLRDASTDAR